MDDTTVRTPIRDKLRDGLLAVITVLFVIFRAKRLTEAQRLIRAGGIVLGISLLTALAVFVWSAL